MPKRTHVKREKGDKHVKRKRDAIGDSPTISMPCKDD